VNYRPLFWVSLCGPARSAGLKLLLTKRTERSRPLIPPRRLQRRNSRICHRQFQAEKDPAPAVLGQLVHRLSPGSALAARAFPTAEAMGGRCPRLERLKFGLLNRRPSFRAPDWVELNFRSFCLRGKGLELGHTDVGAMQEPPTVQPLCHETDPGPSCRNPWVRRVTYPWTIGSYQS
jgi:hypothetical protein